ncbi:MAG: PilN domain-containing protein [Gammaproteobacteria bacterium]|jgi:type IV pilus assembly protein PilN|nr:PilN domain-containing protein [Gammaproteobacteria bacterium]
MADIKINLLPWREELREEKKREFLNVLVGIVVFAGVLIFAADLFYKGSIDAQVARNTFLDKEIKVLEGQIEEIKLLRQKRNELLSRMQVIQELQGNRPVIVRMFDELARRLSERVFYTEITVTDKNIQISGIAESNNRISSQLRNFQESEWFTRPNVTEINAATTFGPQASSFKLSVKQDTPAISGAD